MILPGETELDRAGLYVSYKEGQIMLRDNVTKQRVKLGPLDFMALIKFISSLQKRVVT